MKKILVFAPYYPPHIGGLEAYANELDNQLSIHGNKVTVFTPKLPLSASEIETINENIKIIRFPAFEIVHNYPLPQFWNLKFWRLFLILIREDFDAIVSHTRFFMTSFIALFFAKTKKIKIIHIEHGSSFVQLTSKFIAFTAYIYDKTFGKFVLSNADHVIAISASVKEFVRVLAPKTKCSVIYRGFDFEKITKIRPNLKIKDSYKNNSIVIYIGRLISGKGVADLLQAFSQINRNDVKLFIIGDGPEKNNLIKIAKELKIIDNIVFFGSLPFEEAISILKISTIFVNPSYSEGLPTTVLEAAICKIPVIATDVGGTKEIIKDKENGFLVDKKSPEMIVKHLNVLLEKEKTIKFVINNTNIKKNFSWDNCIEQFIKIIES